MSLVLSGLHNGTNWKLLQVKRTIVSSSNDLYEKINAHILDTRKDTEIISLEIKSKYKSQVVEMLKCKGSMDRNGNTTVH